MNKTTILGLATALLTVAVPARADVRLTMHDGLVTIVAKNATVRQILAEWAKVGQATIVNADRITGGPIDTLELTDVPERQALDILLRSVNGYFVAPRPTVVPNAALFDRIVVLPATTQPRVLTASAPPPLPQPNRFQLPPAPDPDDPVTSAVNDPSLRVPVVNQFNPPFPPPPPAADPGGRAAPAAFAAPTAPVGTSAPGMVLQPPPAQPAQPPPIPGAPPPLPGAPPVR